MRKTLIAALAATAAFIATPAAAQDVAGPVQLLELGGGAVVEDELAHGVLPCRVGAHGVRAAPLLSAPEPRQIPPEPPAAQVCQVTGSAVT